MSFDWTPERLTGAARDHVRQYDAPRFAAVKEVGAAFLAMRASAARDGLDLRPFSSFRDLKTQARIWRRKYTLKATLYDRTGVPLDGAALRLEARIWAILNWSALPGGSRHHWGTEIDVVEGAAVDAGHRVDLLPWETAPGGPFHPLRQWLDENAARFGFHRPYDVDRGGMCAEPWHLSYAALSAPALEALTPEILRRALAAADPPDRALVETLVPEIFERHIRNVAPLFAGCAAHR
ncbi:MAG: M15 family metallopeptidase [Pseudomonadota bacterium]